MPKISVIMPVNNVGPYLRDIAVTFSLPTICGILKAMNDTKTITFGITEG